MMYRLSALSTIAISTALACPAYAQQDGEENIIVVTAQADNASVVLNSGDAGALGDKPAEDLPFTIRSYDETLILNQQPQTLGDVLENDPTIRTTFGFGNAAEQFVVRGFPLFGDDVGLNGLYGVAPRQLVAPELFDSVQVLNGASAFLNGAAPGGSGLGGSVNLQLKRAGNDPLNRVTAGYSSDTHFGGSFDVARRMGEGGEWGLRVNGAYRSGEVAIDREDRKALVLGAALDFDSGPFRAALDLAYQEIRVDSLRPKVTIASEAIPTVPDADANYAQDFTFSDLRDVFGTLSLEYDVADNVLLYARAGARDGREDGIYSGITVNDAVTGDATGSALLVPRTDNNEAVEAGMRIALGSTVTHEINFGGNANWQTNRNAFDFLGGFGGFGTNLYDTPQVTVPGTGFVGGDLDDPFPITDTRLLSAFVSDTVGFWDDRILLTGGLRLQAIRQQNFNYYNGGDLDSIYQEDAITPVVGLVVKPAPGLSFFANRIEALQQGPSAPLDPLIVTNPGETLAPRRSVQYELGGKVRFGTLFASLAAYHIERPGEGILPDGSFGYLGDQRHQGLELTVNGEIAPNLRLIAGAAITDAELDGGNAVPGVADFTANADIEWDLPFVPGMTLTGRAVHTSDQWVDTANTLEINDWTRFDVGARYVFAAGNTPVTLRATIDNIANDRYWASAFDSFSAALLQGRPRTVKASVSVDF
ncbi:TonB-dependent receptor [Novosphingopyxis baekryungensis]|jgi:iron complex outermembrane receptor protein|uniref:TonB-dependent receptor n=1 Tax=Novosphingopyxis baekryungensis TaxID=279369 RepID=UPI000491FA1C|nr:TonB-dependent receptor [Novosphingopyxis baekryungensis]